jgi:hypothetical protein
MPFSRREGELKKSLTPRSGELQKEIDQSRTLFGMTDWVGED